MIPTNHLLSFNRFIAILVPTGYNLLFYHGSRLIMMVIP